MTSAFIYNTHFNFCPNYTFSLMVLYKWWLRDPIVSVFAPIVMYCILLSYRIWWCPVVTKIHRQKSCYNTWLKSFISFSNYHSVRVLLHLPPKLWLRDRSLQRSRAVTVPLIPFLVRFGLVFQQNDFNSRTFVVS